MLGVGLMGAFHAETLSTRVRGARVSVVNDFFTDKASEIAAGVGARVVEDPIAAIQDPEVDAVLIASPGAAHEAQVNACLDAGIPVFCEKPLTTDVASAYRIVQQEAALGRSLVQVGFMRRFDPEYVALKDLITSGGLGNVLLVHCTHRNPTVGDHFNSEFMIRDSVVHEVDVARFLLDEEIASVQVITSVPTSIAPEGTADPMLVIFETTSGRVVTDEVFVRSQVAYEVRTEVVGEQGSAFIGLDQNLMTKTTDGRWGGRITPGSWSGSRRRTRSSCSAGWTPPGGGRSTGRESGTGTPRSRCARRGRGAADEREGERVAGAAAVGRNSGSCPGGREVSRGQEHSAGSVKPHDLRDISNK